MTILTQIGGVIYLLSLFLKRKFEWGKLKLMVSFLMIYLLFTFLIFPILAPFGGRVPLPITGNLQPLTIWTVLLNRHYVRDDLKLLMIEVSDQMEDQFSEAKTNYLDANFPFYGGFPLFPHLSHNDGRKLDLAFYYLKDGERSDSAPSFMGYGIYEDPISGELDYPQRCRDQGFWQYGILGKFFPDGDEENYEIDSKRTRSLLLKLSNHSAISKIFIEPHLKTRWSLSKHDKIRFHGCQAVRHDDHIHFQIN